MAEELKDVAVVIKRLSSSTNFDNNNKLIHKTLKDSEMDKNFEENVGLRRKIVFLEEQVKEKEHCINLLEESLNKEKTSISCSRDSKKYFLVNSTTQV